MRKFMPSTWDAYAERPLQIAAFIFLAAYAIPIINPALPPTVSIICSVLVAVTWGAFGVDYFVRLLLAPQRWAWFRHNLLSLAVLIVPVLRPLRLLRLVTMLSVLNRASMWGLRERVAVYAAGGVTLLVVCGALAVTDAERGQAGASINGFGEGLWWAIVTITTVGYGDLAPVTLTGHLVAVCLTVGGIGLLGTVSGMLASWLVEQIRPVAEGPAQAPAMSDELIRLDQLRAQALLTDEEFAAAKSRLLGL